MPYSIALLSTLHYSTIHNSTILYSTVLQYTVLNWTVRYRTLPYYTMLCCTTLYSTVLLHTVQHCNVLYCTVLRCTYHRFEQLWLFCQPAYALACRSLRPLCSANLSFDLRCNNGDSENDKERNIWRVKYIHSVKEIER